MDKKYVLTEEQLLDLLIEKEKFVEMKYINFCDFCGDDIYNTFGGDENEEIENSFRNCAKLRLCEYELLK